MSRQSIWGPGTCDFSLFFSFFLKSVYIWCSSRFDLLCSFAFYGELWKLFRVINKFSEVVMLHKSIVVLFHKFFPGIGTEVIHISSSPLSFGNRLWRPLICVSSCQSSQLLKAWTSHWQCRVEGFPHDSTDGLFHSPEHARAPILEH